jgi:hypothetical protein
VSRENEAFMPAEMIRRVLASATSDVVLVGGQALAYWMSVLDIRQPDHIGPAISRDVDFFTANAADTSPLAKFARAINGYSHVENMESLSALIGSAIAPAEDERIYNVDLLHKVVGIERHEIEKHAVEVQLPDGNGTIRVMHPIHVLQSRNMNLHKLVEKQDEIGALQYVLAIAVARAYLELRIESIEARTDLTDTERERSILNAIRRVSEYASEDAARKNAERYGVHLADAIPAWRIKSSAFWKKQWPYLRSRMSQEHARRCEEWNEDI